ncbi:MAG: TRAP transporter substrate-binding protein [Alphaproteobacteria bacterium]|nr:TRAP transporter substrate-binding protein [Alphaproteobacteria bacterium]
MFRKIVTATALAAALSVSALATAGAAEKSTLKFAVFTPDKEMTFTVVMKPWADRVMKDSNGTLQIQLFPNGALGRHPGKQLKMVQDGVADIGWIIPAYTPGRFPDNAVFQLPALINTSKEGSIAAWRLYKKGMLRGYENYYVIGLFTTSPYTIHTKTKLTSMAQLKGKKIRAVGPAMVASIKALGGAPEPMPFTKIVEAISRGRIDGTTAHPIALHDFGVAKVTSSHYFGRLGTVPLAIMMNRKVYEKLPAAAKAAIDKNSGEQLSVAFGNMSDNRNAELRGLWSKEAKRTVTVPSATETAKWDAALAPVISAWSGKHPKGKALLSALKAELANIRAGK